MSAAVLLAVAALGLAPDAPATGRLPPCASCLTWQVTTTQARRILFATEGLEGLDLLVADAPAPPPELAAVLRELRERGARAGLGLPLDASDGCWEAATEADFVVLILDAAASPSREQAFHVKARATGLRARRPGLRVGLDAGDAALARLWTTEVPAYVDFVVVPAGDPHAVRASERWQRTPASSAGDVLAASAQAAGGRVVAVWPGCGDALDAPFALLRVRELMPAALAPLPSVAVECSSERGDRAGPACEAAAFLHPAGDVIVLVQPRRAVTSLRITGGVPVGGDDAAPVRLYDLGSPWPPAALAGAGEGASARVALPALGTPFVLQFEGWGRAQGLFESGVDVVARRSLTVEEVLARHQGWAARQRRIVPRLISSGSLVIAFPAPGLSAPVTVTAQVTLYSGPHGTDVEQRDMRLNGLPLGGDVPRLPIVEPERVASVPLAITLDEAYRYRLDGEERVAGRRCHRVAFEPAQTGPAFRGRAWIDADEFALVKMEAVQAGLRGPIVSSQQTDEFAAMDHGGARLWLLARSEVHQVYEGPGHRTPIDRVLVVRRHEPDPPDFACRLAAAHASDAVMLRETASGWQYLRKPEVGERAGEPATEGTRVPAGKSAAVRTLAVGVLVDPNIGDPLPFAGAGYSDFDLLGTGTQLNAFLAGSFAQISWSAPSVLGSRWRLQAAAVASLVEYNDRVFRNGVEQYDENLRQRPARLALEVSRPLARGWRVRAGYELDYTRLRGSELTAPGFGVPESPLAHGLRLALEAQHGPWSASAWWRPARRQRWRAWGWPDDPEGGSLRRSYQRFGLTFGRNFVVSPRALGRVELAAMGGSGLDRFSRYSFDGFENRLTGYPVASVRYDRGLVARSSLSWQARPWMRLQAFADAAHVRDAGFGPRARTLAGLGAGLDVVLPGRSLLAAEWGWGPQGRDRDGQVGTHTLRLTAYRVF